MQIHGLLDGVVPFEGKTELGMKSIEDVIEYNGGHIIHVHLIQL